MALEGPLCLQSLQHSMQQGSPCKQAVLPLCFRDPGSQHSAKTPQWLRAEIRHLCHTNGAENSLCCSPKSPREKPCFVTLFSAASLKSKMDFCYFHNMLYMDVWVIWDQLCCSLYCLYQNQMQVYPYVVTWPEGNGEKSHPPASSSKRIKIKPVVENNAHEGW